MDIDTHILVDDAVERVRQALLLRDQAAVAVVEADHEVVLSDSGYLLDTAAAAAFEQRVAEEALKVKADRLAMAVPQIMKVDDPDTASLRSPVTGLPDEETEQEVVLWMAWDDEGVHYGAIPYTRSGGKPVFSHEAPSWPVGPARGTPGTTLLRHLLDEDLRPRRT